MSRFSVVFTSEITTVIEVEAGDWGEAIDLAYESDDMPGDLGYSAFGRASVSHDGTWEPNSVENSDDGAEVWNSRDGERR